MARPKADNPKTRKKILAVSEKIFAMNGFDGARMDEIAKKAQVNKALIYYYFKSKDAILEELYDSFIARCAMHSRALFENIESILSKKYMHGYFHETIEFLEKNTDILRVIMIESLKKSKRVPLLMKTIGTYTDAQAKHLIRTARSKGIHVETNVQQMLVTEFFTKSVPVMFFILFHEAWVDYFKIKEEYLKEWFIAAIESTHMAHHHAAK